MFFPSHFLQIKTYKLLESSMGGNFCKNCLLFYEFTRGRKKTLVLCSSKAGMKIFGTKVIEKSFIAAIRRLPTQITALPLFSTVHTLNETPAMLITRSH